MSQLGCMSSGNKLKQKKGPWSLGEEKAKVRCLGEEEGVGKGAGILPRGRIFKTWEGWPLLYILSAETLKDCRTQWRNTYSELYFWQNFHSSRLPLSDL